MKMKKQAPQEKVKPADQGAPSAPAEEATETLSKNVTCSYGIHRGNFPVAGMKVRDARAILKKLIKVDPAAIAVINGEEVAEDETISAETTLLSFVKPSAKKGSDAIVIEGGYAKLDGKKMDAQKFCGLVSKNTISGIGDEPIPDNVKWLIKAGDLTMYIIELKPELRRIKWVAENGDDEGEGYKKRKLATPYIVLAVPFVKGQLHRALELFYRNQPLTSLDDPLYTCNLLNVSMGRSVEGCQGLKTWVCTQYLQIGGLKAHSDILSEIISHIFGGGFNRSSDRNEGASGFSTYESQCSDKRVNNVTRWEKESEKNPRFVLEVDWLDANCTPRDLIQFRMKQFQAVEAPATSKAIGNILLASKMLA